MADQNYQTILNRLVTECPMLGRPLAYAEKIRSERLSFFLENTG